MATIIKSSSNSDDSRAIGKPTQSLIWNFIFFGHAKNFNLNYCPHWPILNLLDNFTWIGCLLPTHHQCLTVTSSSNTIFWLVVSNSWIRWRHKSSTCKKQIIRWQNYDFISYLWCSEDIIIIRNDLFKITT